VTTVQYVNFPQKILLHRHPGPACHPLDKEKTLSRMHEHKVKFWLRFLSIILRVLRLDVSVWISKNIGKKVWFSNRFSSLLLYSVQ